MRANKALQLTRPGCHDARPWSLQLNASVRALYEQHETGRSF